MNIFERWGSVGDVRQEAREARERMLRGMPRRDRGPSRWLIAALGAGAGAAAAFLLDPQRGRSRRARLADQGAARLRDVGTVVARGSRRAGMEAFAVRQRATHRGGTEPLASDAALSDRVETELFADPAVPQGKINVNVEEGVVVLRGEVEDGDQASSLIRKAERIPGVLRVDSLLHLPGEPAPPEPPRKHATVSTEGPAGPLP